MKLIDKDKVVAEIERRISLFQKEKETEKWSAGASQINVVSLGARIAMLEEILSFLNTLEVKDVAAEQEGICNGILNTIIGDTWHIKIPLNKEELKHGDKVKIFITKEK